MILTPEDVATPLWHKLREYLDGERTRLRIRNDSLDTDERQTIINRAQIRVLTQLLDLEKRARQ
jgi:hypothetical protein